jgi:hypothetical protein
MKKLSTLIVLIALSAVVTIFSCKKSLDQYLKMDYASTVYPFNNNLNMYVYQTQGYSQIVGTNGPIFNTLTANISGITPNTYLLGPTATSSITLTKGTLTFSSQGAGGWGSLTISSMDNSKMYAQGSFYGTLINTLNSGDSISIFNGTFAIKYQF